MGLTLRCVMMVSLLLLATSCRCVFWCYDDTNIQRNYVGDRDACQSQAEREVGQLSRVTKTGKERNATLLALFAKCMHKKNWGVTSPKKEKKKKKDTAENNFPGIPPATPAFRDTSSGGKPPEAYDDPEKYGARRVENAQSQPPQRQAQSIAPPPQQYRQQPPPPPQQQRYYQQYAPPPQYPQQQQPQQPPPPQIIQREIIREVPARQPQPQPQPQQPPQIIERQIIREVPAKPQPQQAPRIIEKHYIQRAPAPQPLQPAPRPYYYPVPQPQPQPQPQMHLLRPPVAAPRARYSFPSNPPPENPRYTGG